MSYVILIGVVSVHIQYMVYNCVYYCMCIYIQHAMSICLIVSFFSDTYTYQRGVLSYPRTETNFFQEGIGIHIIIHTYTY
jgi:hypothetical protein